MEYVSNGKLGEKKNCSGELHIIELGCAVFLLSFGLNTINRSAYNSHYKTTIFSRQEVTSTGTSVFVGTTSGGKGNQSHSYLPHASGLLG